MSSKRAAVAALPVHVWIAAALSPLFGAGCGACEPDQTASPALGPETGPALIAASPSGRERPWDRLAMNPARSLIAADGGSGLASRPCRAIAVEGAVAQEGDAGSPIPPSAELAPAGWLSLGPDARLVAKDPRTARETTFRGPGRARACVDASEESWLERGTFESAPGSGESPGAEEWLVSPLGVVRFAAAKLKVEALAQQVRVGVPEGVAFVWTARDALLRAGEGGAAGAANDAPGLGGAVDGGVANGSALRAEEWGEGWVRLSGQTAILAARIARPGIDAARSAVNVCFTTGKTAGDLAAQLLSGADGGNGDGWGGRGFVAGRQVAARRIARAACAVAALRLESLEGAARQKAAIPPLAASLDQASTFWRSLPLVH